MSKETLAVALGLLRDLVVAVIGLGILFGVSISNEQIAGILLVVSTAFALGTWFYQMRKGGGISTASLMLLTFVLAMAASSVFGFGPFSWWDGP